VKSDQLKTSVRRRYNDFAWLRDILASTYEGLFIPSIPATIVFNTKSTLSGGRKTDLNGEFVKNRMAQLNLFMQQICSIPFLRSDPSLHSFFTVSCEKEFKQITEAPISETNGGGVDNWANIGLSMWAKLVDAHEVHQEEADCVINDFKRQLDVLSATLAQVDNGCRAVGRKAVQYAAQMKGLGDLVRSWAATEAQLLDPHANRYVDPCGKKKRECMDGLVQGQDHWTLYTAV
jgi:hypothetical protein